LIAAAARGQVCATLPSNLAGKYLKGDGLPADRAQATSLHRKACRLGDGGACRYLAAHP
jgi:TPR repeat protein